MTVHCNRRDCYYNENCICYQPMRMHLDEDGVCKDYDDVNKLRDRLHGTVAAPLKGGGRW